MVFWKLAQKAGSDNGFIFNGRPHVHFCVNVKFLVFTPVEGEYLEGTVNKVGEDHIGLLVHGVFNVAVVST